MGGGVIIKLIDKDLASDVQLDVRVLNDDASVNKIILTTDYLDKMATIKIPYEDLRALSLDNYFLILVTINGEGSLTQTPQVLVEFVKGTAPIKDIPRAKLVYLSGLGEWHYVVFNNTTLI